MVCPFNYCTIAQSTSTMSIDCSIKLSVDAMTLSGVRFTTPLYNLSIRLLNVRWSFFEPFSFVTQSQTKDDSLVFCFCSLYSDCFAPCLYTGTHLSALSLTLRLMQVNSRNWQETIKEEIQEEMSHHVSCYSGSYP